MTTDLLTLVVVLVVGVMLLAGYVRMAEAATERREDN